MRTASRVRGPATARPGRAFAVLAALSLAAFAATFAIAALLRAASAGAPATSPFAPLRVESGHGIATGFALGDGRVVTVAHVIDGPVTVRSRRVRVVRRDRRNDLALLAGARLRARGSVVRAAVLEIARVADGQHLRVVRLRGGRSSSLSADVRRAIVAHVGVGGARRALVRPALELSARVAPGDSGAPAITDDGRLAGVVFAASRNRADTAYAVDASAVSRLLRGG